MAPKLKQIKVDEVLKLARLGLTTREIAACLDVAHDTLYKRMQKKPAISDAIARGRAELASKCASVVIAAAVGKTELNATTGQLEVVKEADPKYALEVVRRFAGNWQDKALIEQNTNVIVQGSEAAQQLGDDAMTRMAKAWLRSRGQE